MIFDFGRNTYQYSIAFKFNCLDSYSIKNLVQHLLVEKKRFSTVSKGDQDSAILSQGAGNEQDPFFQLTLREDNYILAAGWYADYENWRKWRDQLLADSAPFLKTISLDFVAQISGQSSLAIPQDKFKDPANREQFAAVKKLLQMIVPEEMLRRGNFFSSFGDEKGRDAVDLWTTPVGAGVAQENISFSARRMLFDEKMTLDQAVAEHARFSDHLLERFHSDFLTLILRS
jgi:hypothetical protein